MTELIQNESQEIAELEAGQQVALREGYLPAVITVSGKDRPGVTAAFFRVLSANQVQVLDVEQSMFRGFLNLAAFVGIAPERVETVTTGLTDTLKVHGQSVVVELQETVQSSRPRSSHVVVVLGDPVDALDISRIGQTLADYDANIDTIRGISDYPVTGLELKVTVPDVSPGGGEAMRKALAALTSELNVDIAIERSGLLRRSKRLVCFDCDSTLITGEVIEMLAAHAGKEAEVAAVTERAMRGELDFEESLRERVKALAGLDASVIDEVAAAIELTPGARTTIRTLNRMGYQTAVVSGGFIQVLEGLAEELELDYVRANTLEIVDGKLTGNVTGKIVDRAAKAEFLREFAADSGLKMYQTVAVGDGANDIDMLSAAGLGVAFNAKPALKEIADTSVNHPFLDEVLHIMGISRDEIDLADQEDGTFHRVPLTNA
ncbi:phosphoserine phosphatase [Corynebacterium glutamicum MB001]|uniref:phosphoserine phosphatase n=2 Tax=Corynebacterium TaxID=1716 RepID=A0A0F6Z7R3_9CORY|nr:phosphoserine phosphatase [Corynebacterium glutamicum MB001]AKF28322.1 phosphoserine phosphatase [[Brevibacterium] flavum]ALP50936.1 phosphoserine phosphatase [Corynebacterium glutamicum]ANR63398.1 phosphoserine phosphatase [[Brevibacterium] flavum ZL-1]ANR66403.1 phosphoserine phosphatase [Corynebacterium glutamicum ZL-6]AST21571.1 phosphoserine phosphatase SerB [Corynebacterium glutamicum ATCC 14067]PST74928.1 phosphoserine phosphatase [Corynebacterium glutamicum ZL-2]CCH25656.1 phospho